MTAPTKSSLMGHKPWLFLLGFAVLGISQPLLAGVVLSFDHNPLVNFEPISQDYGDRVTASPDALDHRYELVDDGFGNTPNVEVAYGGSIPSIRTSGYGDLV